MKISVIGLGAYSLAITKMLAKKNNEIYVWTESSDRYNEWKKTKKLKSIFDISIPKNVKISTDLKEVVENSDIIYIVTASKFVDIICEQIKSFYDTKTPICIASKGIEETEEELLSNIVKNKLLTHHIAVISGPTFAIDIINNEPVALALGSVSNKAKKLVINTLAGDTLKLRPTKDIIGIQLCGSIKNVIAIASGIIGGLGYSDSARAFLINESLHDIKDIIYYLGGNPKTILSFAGVGDLMLTCTSTKSRNYSFGFCIGSTKDPNKIKKFLMNNTVEGYNTLDTIHDLLMRKNIKIDLIDVIYDIVYNNANPYNLVNFLIAKK